MAADSWMKRAGGLLVPKKELAVNRPCCCSCPHCSSSSVISCVQIDIDGVTEGTWDEYECSCFGSFKLPSISNCVWERNLFNWWGGSIENTNVATLELELRGSDYVLSLNISMNTNAGFVGIFRWEKNYGAVRPDCSSWVEEELSLVTDAGLCDASMSTCKVTVIHNDACEYVAPCKLCDDCDDPDVEEYQLVWAGLTGSLAQFNDTFIAQRRTDNPCDYTHRINDNTWAHLAFVGIGALDPLFSPNYQYRASLSNFPSLSDGPVITLSRVRSTNLARPIDCDATTNLVLTAIPPGAGYTCTITAI